MQHIMERTLGRLAGRLQVLYASQGLKAWRQGPHREGPEKNAGPAAKSAAQEPTVAAETTGPAWLERTQARTGAEYGMPQADSRVNKTRGEQSMGRS